MQLEGSSRIPRPSRVTGCQPSPISYVLPPTCTALHLTKASLPSVNHTRITFIMLYYICPVDPFLYHTNSLASCFSQAPNLDSLYGYLTSSSFLNHICFFFFVGTCSTHICFASAFMNFLIYLGSQSSEATPRSLQQRIRALDLHPSVAVGMPSGEK